AAAGGTILRINFFGSVGHARKTISEWIAAGIARGERVPLVNDVLFNPLHIGSLCRLLLQVIQRPLAGRFNMGSRGGISKHDFGVAMASALGLDAGLIKAVEV